MESFNKLLDEYSGNYVQFLTTGIADYERAYKNAQNLIEKTLDEKRQQVDKEKRDMKHFAESYRDDNKELSGMFNSASDMYKDAQKIQDKFETSKQRYADFTRTHDPSKAINISNGYNLLLRIGIILVLLPLLFAFGVYMITGTSVSTSQSIIPTAMATTLTS
jgi:hypothetical protein